MSKGVFITQPGREDKRKNNPGGLEMNWKAANRTGQPDGYEQWEQVTIQEIKDQAIKQIEGDFIAVEDYLAQKIRKPDYNSEALVMNSAGILRLIGIEDARKAMCDRVHNWLLKHRYRMTGTHNFHFTLVDKHPRIRNVV
ncbi:hypothetical protein ACOYR4_15495 [Acidovorax sp. M14]|uniref:hypothetical protein n=1 Tax=Acidovorax sp. M14 TaxID=3411354 RepID=UPI003BF486DA